jgi:hypothetical protein
MIGKDWFNIMTEQEQNDFIHAYNLERPRRMILREYLALDFTTFRGFMMSSFAWHVSPQGPDYWVDVLNKYRNVELGTNLYFKKSIKEFTL